MVHNRHVFRLDRAAVDGDRRAVALEDNAVGGIRLNRTRHERERSRIVVDRVRELDEAVGAGRTRNDLASRRIRRIGDRQAAVDLDVAVSGVRRRNGVTREVKRNRLARRKRQASRLDIGIREHLDRGAVLSGRNRIREGRIDRALGLIRENHHEARGRGLSREVRSRSRNDDIVDRAETFVGNGRNCRAGIIHREEQFASVVGSRPSSRNFTRVVLIGGSHLIAVDPDEESRTGSSARIKLLDCQAVPRIEVEVIRDIDLNVLDWGLAVSRTNRHIEVGIADNHRFDRLIRLDGARPNGDLLFARELRILFEARELDELIDVDLSVGNRTVERLAARLELEVLSLRIAVDKVAVTTHIHRVAIRVGRIFLTVVRAKIERVCDVGRPDATRRPCCFTDTCFVTFEAGAIVRIVGVQPEGRRNRAN